jgi:hypothetical protein
MTSTGSAWEVNARRLSNTGALGVITTINTNGLFPTVALEGNAGAYVVAYDSGNSVDVSEVNSSDVVIHTFSAGAGRFGPAVSINAHNEYLVTYDVSSGSDTSIAGRRALL